MVSGPEEDASLEASMVQLRNCLRDLENKFMKQSEDPAVQGWLSKIDTLLTRSRSLPKTIIAVAGNRSHT